MSQVNDFFTERELKDIRTDALTRRKEVVCQDIAKDKNDLAFVAQGQDRCAFITNTKDEIVKVAKNKNGVKANKRASNIFLVDKDQAEKTFAMPKDIEENGVAMVQEEVTMADELSREKLKELATIPEPVSHRRQTKEQLKGRLVSQVDDKLMMDVGQVKCLDVVEENIGVKDNTPVLADLGECDYKDEGNRIKIKQKVNQ